VSVTLHEKRLRALESTYGIGGSGGPGEACPECGRLPDREPFGTEDTYELVFVEEDEEMPEEDVYCESCGELIIGVISFDDE
jgi:hypothetical protein